MIKSDMKVNVSTFLLLMCLAIFAKAQTVAQIESAFKSGNAAQGKALMAKFLAEQDTPEAYEKIGTMFARLKQWDQALHYIEIAKNRKPRDPNLNFKLGVAYHQNKNSVEAIQTFRKALSLDPKSLPIIFALGEVLEVSNDGYDARQVYTDSLKKNPDVNELQRKLCLLNFMENYWKEAAAYCTKAVRKDKLDAQSAAILAMAYYEGVEREKAVEILRSAIKANPKAAVLHRVRGLIYYREKTFEQAAYELGMAAGLDAQDDEAMIFLARSFYELGRYNDARIAYFFACRLDPSYRFEFISKQKDLMKKGRAEMAAEYAQSVEKI